MQKSGSTRWFEDLFPQGAALVILHPNFADQHLVLPLIVSQSKRTPIFLGLQSPDTDLRTLWTSLSGILAEQFDRPLPELDAKTTPDKAAQTLLKALKPLENYTLFIDSFDYADETSVAPWIVALLKGLPVGCQIVLGTRRLPTLLVDNQAIHDKVVLFPSDPNRMLLDYTSQPPGKVLLEVYGHGLGQAYVNGKLINKWDGVLPRSLFFYFIDRGMTTRDEIFKTFWPSLSVREATNVFHVTKRKISEILGFDLTVYWSGFYRISSNIDLHYDVVKFAEDIQNSAVANDKDAIPLLERALYLYRGTFLSNLEAAWTVNRREELRLTYVDALSSLARLRERHKEYEQALGLYLRASSIQPHREDLARGIMGLYRQLGQPDRAVAVYQRLTAELKKQLGVAPDRRTTEMVDQIRAARR